MEWQIALTIIMISFVVLLILGVPLAVTLGIVGMVFMMVTVGDKLSFDALGMSAISNLGSYNLLAIPLFVVMGELMFIGGVIDDIYNVASKWVSRLPGGLALVTIASCAIFSTCSGSNIAATTTIGKLSIPQMMKRGYSKSLTTGCIVAAGGLAQLIPPSIIMVIYATFAEVSIGQMLMAGLIPGFLLAGGYAIAVITWALVRPKEAPRCCGSRSLTAFSPVSVSACWLELADRSGV